MVRRHHRGDHQSHPQDQQLESYNRLAKVQKGCRRRSYGCKDQLRINKAILEEVRSKRRNLSTTWIDYKKAFDSVPHTWTIKWVELYKICPTITRFVNHDKGMMTSRKIEIKSGIYQGDSLSPLMFCLALVPLISLLNKSGYGHNTPMHGKISHLFYMDDLTTYAKNDDDQTGQPRAIKSSSNIELDVNTAIQDLEQEGTYKYLGVSEGEGIQHSQMKEKIRKEYYRRIRMVLKSELNSANKLEAINTLAVPTATYSYNIINWTLQELDKLDTKTRKFLTMYKMHHPKSDVDRLYLLRTEGGRELIQLELSYKTTTIGLDK